MLITHDTTTWRQVLRHGDRGADVAYWQAGLLAIGADLSGDDAGDFGPGTHNATLAFQRLHGLTRDAEVGTRTRTVLAEAGRLVRRPPEPVLPSLVPLTDWDALPFVQARHYRAVSGTPRAINLLVVHCMEAPEASTRAERCAYNFSTTDRVASAHACVDDDTIVRCVRDEDVAYAAPGANHDGLQLELAGYARQTREQWLDAFGVAMLRNAARVLEAWYYAYDVPLVFVEAANLRGGRGVTTHGQVTLAYGKSTHVDPGPSFPMDWLLDRAREVRSARDVT